MREYIELYIQNQKKIEDFIENSISNLDSLSSCEESKFKRLFKIFPSLELVYIIDSVTNEQISANFSRYFTDENSKNKDRSYLMDKLVLKGNDYAFSQSYQSSATKNICITVTKKEDNHIIFMDFELEILLERLGIIEKHKFFSAITKAFYMLSGFFMMFLSVSAIFYSGHEFIANVFESKLSIDTIFKPIIAATLGLAIFDLSKTILEQEVYFKSYVKDSKLEIKVLTKFLITILIALSIETLMVVFKIAIDNYDKMLSALYLMIGTSLFIFAISTLIFLTKKK